jgi:uncharacterized membrane protein
MLNNRPLQGFLAITPIILFILFFVAYFMFIFSVAANGGNSESDIMAGIGMFILVAIITAIVSLLSFVYFLIHAAKNPNLENNNSSMRIVWILVIVLVSGLGPLIYWIAEIEAKKPRPVIQ